ncbi:MAG: AAA family ATPase, partial [Thermodesulfobacteriota bacterium]|nr:AAA family ATPase [Thermodesulfobacteriota bacterium]
MKIKKVSILGFKSFVDRLEITFPLGISGVVGPNGCGKSNIVDAIRWCMGEQSPKELRGRRMEDVIFNGAAENKPMGMAEVSMLLENGDGIFPPAFSQDTEIMVTRRLFRSGESEYLINNVPCRLRDIQEVFMDTGLGNKAYSIIGQGKIGMILDQRPEDTRIMLEEAAGITKYRKKVEASQKKIELTESNLQRVEDILGEVQGQIRSLKRQASKAKRYKAISEEIRNLELVLYANTYHELKEASGNKQMSMDELVEQEIAKSAELSHNLAKTETINLELEERDGDLSGCRKALLNLKERVNKKETEIESLTGEIRMQEELEGRLSDERREIENRLASLKEDKENLENKIDKTKVRSLELERETSLKKNRLDSRRELLKTIKEDYEKARMELSAGASKEVGLNHESGYLS